MTTQDHWQNVYSTKDSTQVSWFQAQVEPSLSAIAKLNVSKSAAFIDVGGGASLLVDALLSQGWPDVAVLDIAESALAIPKRRLGAHAEKVSWIAADITTWQPKRRYDIWHDRAVFHFLTEVKQRDAYRKAILAGLAPGGYAILATFAHDGPEKCSGLPVQRYDAETLQKELGSQLLLRDNWREVHHTPAGGKQKFNWCLFQRV